MYVYAYFPDEANTVLKLKIVFQQSEWTQAFNV
jgi:hypothetical protein